MLTVSLLEWIPDFLLHGVIYTLFAVGLLGYIGSKLISWIPATGIYRLVFDTIGVSSLVVASCLYGSLSYREKAAQELASAVERVRKAEEKAAVVNTVVETKVIENIKVVKENVYINNQKLNKVKDKFDAICTIPNSIIGVHNDASQNQVSGSSGDLDGTPSSVKASDLIETVIENYGAAQQNIETIKGWQQWYIEQKQIFDEANK